MALSFGSFAQSVTIGNQLWMNKNLDVSTFRNGDSIMQAKNEKEWKKAGEDSKPAWCYFENDSKNGLLFGKLYNWYAVNDPRGLAPEGYHIPSNEEWNVLIDFLGGIKVAGEKLKSSSNWEYNFSSTNESGFSGLPGSYRHGDGIFHDFLGDYGYWWSYSLDTNSENFCGRFLFTGDGNVYSGCLFEKADGLSVRCVKD